MRGLIYTASQILKQEFFLKKISIVILIIVLQSWPLIQNNEASKMQARMKERLQKACSSVKYRDKNFKLDWEFCNEVDADFSCDVSGLTDWEHKGVPAEVAKKLEIDRKEVPIVVVNKTGEESSLRYGIRIYLSNESLEHSKVIQALVVKEEEKKKSLFSRFFGGCCGKVQDDNEKISKADVGFSYKKLSL